MRLLSVSKSSNTKKLAFLGAQAFLTGSICRYVNPAAGFSSLASSNRFANNDSIRTSPISSRSTMGTSISSRLFSSVEGLTNVDKQGMEEIIEDYEQGGREESGYVIMDVRETSEVAQSGKLSPNTITLPLSLIGNQNVFGMDEDEFEIVCGFPKPSPDETLVFSCAAGIRSKNACAYAAQNGYTKLVNYMGGAYDWFAN
mmetsp:Transcript_19189/g.47792  ORF Transcript_19189/g.47792 Transcript_19189/m.47792 type:complete len:200 (+) Transcript_19189:98-697(+)